MAYTAINKSTDNFECKLWTGNETDNRDITGFSFQPDFAWIKQEITLMVMLCLMQLEE